MHLEISGEHKKIGVRCPTSGVHLSGDNCSFKHGGHLLEVFDGDEHIPVDRNQKIEFKFVLELYQSININMASASRDFSILPFSLNIIVH